MMLGKHDHAVDLAAAGDTLYDGPRSEAEEILYERYLHDLDTRLGRRTDRRAPLDDTQLEAILSTLVRPNPA
jgi:hypothetical protein